MTGEHLFAVKERRDGVRPDYFVVTDGRTYLVDWHDLVPVKVEEIPTLDRLPPALSGLVIAEVRTDDQAAIVILLENGSAIVFDAVYDPAESRVSRSVDFQTKDEVAAWESEYRALRRLE
jgi:hypothetical protein